LKATPESVGHTIDTHSYLNTTAQTLSYLKRKYTDSFIIESLAYCSTGNKLALLSLLEKEVIKYNAIERPEMEYKDIIEELRSE
jgi:hypothetical protein